MSNEITENNEVIVPIKFKFIKQILLDKIDQIEPKVSFEEFSNLLDNYSIEEIKKKCQDSSLIHFILTNNKITEEQFKTEIKNLCEEQKKANRSFSPSFLLILYWWDGRFTDSVSEIFEHKIFSIKTCPVFLVALFKKIFDNQKNEKIIEVAEKIMINLLSCVNKFILQIYLDISLNNSPHFSLDFLQKCINSIKEKNRETYEFFTDFVEKKRKTVINFDNKNNKKTEELEEINQKNMVQIEILKKKIDTLENDLETSNSLKEYYYKNGQTAESELFKLKLEMLNKDDKNDEDNKDDIKDSIKKYVNCGENDDEKRQKINEIIKILLE
jgi:hypothetical protein